MYVATAFNLIGAIEVTDQDTHHIVNVIFHDQSSRKGYHFTDHFKYDLASMGERGIIYACLPENDNPAQVLYKPYTSWSSSSSQYEWTYTLERGSKVIGLAAGGSKLTSSSKARNDDDDTGNLVIATSKNDLTFISGQKMQKFIMGLDGEFVSMAAGEEWVFVVHRPGATTIDGAAFARL
jgi:chromosome transmission fidelity protein 4